mmetsp:Transcript_20102/g.33862  ORF Transcript_20102/g.33862 Transcript_20102/m.33862 type:complete len:336 (-) Transcript_20102:266-1273(-)|eukprot:CAMPEP_0114427676 /NCGR_PEP_ID=MMETSP0103-20121206/8489_1 /TAXON_ID=37642 ORGANISM="Paraphysomonas imperforata, Strain PA2" /NCGR_SAMPLE_ID=MMETSP0103 /ASSEMBLY_ACC=CAM_ASM_000201 /LENGTH=335 /DNA_ID=CAMNT_0001596781 /DNA_START=71 /DNA_END=1078 /DNA_ORIENTATION=-
MFTRLVELFDGYELVKAVGIALVIVGMVRTWAYAIKERTEDEQKQQEIEDGEKNEKLLNQIVPVSKTIYDENNCGVCKQPIWSRDGIEIDAGSTVELKCTHRFHWHCLNKKSSSSSLTDLSYVIVDKVPCCPECHFQPTIIEAKPLHKWQTIRYWVLIIDDALDQLATHSGVNGISWASIRARARKMSGITVEQLAKGDEQTHGKEDMLADEDLDGPGNFPYFAALKDGNGIRYQDASDNAFHKSAGKWCTYKSDRGGERMVFKYSWGLPPSVKCHNCQKFIEALDDDWQDCKKCGHLGVEKLFWCSEGCKATHTSDCEKELDKYERFRVKKNLT